MIISALRPCRFKTTGALLLTAGMLLAAGGAAQAQLNPQELLKQVLPGASQDSDDSAASGERACQRYAEKQGLEVRKISDTSHQADPQGRDPDYPAKAHRTRSGACAAQVRAGRYPAAGRPQPCIPIIHERSSVDDGPNAYAYSDV